MGFLDLFALLILAVRAASLVGLWVLLGMLPGMIARKRQHPQANAISVCGWWGAVTLDEILKQYCSIEGYLTQGLGLSADEITKLRERLLQ